MKDSPQKEQFILTAVLLDVLIGNWITYRVVHNQLKHCVYIQIDKEKQLVEAILKSANIERKSDGRKSLACVRAFKLAKEFETEVIEIGRLCNQHKIRICKCQLGCFK